MSPALRQVAAPAAFRGLKGLLALCLALLAALLGGCAAPAPVAAPPALVSPLQLAVESLTDDVLARAARQHGVSRVSPRALALEFDAGQPYAAKGVAADVHRWVAERVSRQHPAFLLDGEKPAGAAAPDRWLLRTKLVAPERAGEVAPGAAQVLLMELVAQPSGVLIASSRTTVTDARLDPPVRPSQAPKVTEAPVPTKPPAPSAATLQAWGDEYIALLKRGRDAEAQAIFGRIVTAGLAAHELGVKFLFANGSAEFWPDPALTRQYEMWLSEISRQLASSTQCLVVVGHASRRGSEAYNLKLSTQRAEVVRKALLEHQQSLVHRVSVQGLGYAMAAGDRERPDVMDRRVELKVVGCP